MGSEKGRGEPNAKVQVLPQAEEGDHGSVWNVELGDLVADAFY